MAQPKSEKADRDDDIGLVYLHKIFQIKAHICRGDIQNGLFVRLCASLSRAAQRITTRFIIHYSDCCNGESTYAHHRGVSGTGRVTPQCLAVHLHIPFIVFDSFFLKMEYMQLVAFVQRKDRGDKCSLFFFTPPPPGLWFSLC